MTERFPITSAVEQAVNNKIDSIMGNKDTNLNTLVKMSLMEVDTDEIQYVLKKMADSNAVEKYWTEKEYELTMDCCGNLIPVNSINGEKENQQDN